MIYFSYPLASLKKDNIYAIHIEKGMVGSSCWKFKKLKIGKIYSYWLKKKQKKNCSKS